MTASRTGGGCLLWLLLVLFAGCGTSPQEHSLLELLPRARYSPGAAAQQSMVSPGGTGREALCFTAPGSVSFPVEISPGSVLQFGVALAPGVEAGQDAEFEVLIQWEDQPARRLFCAGRHQQDASSEEGWLDWEVDLGDFSGRQVELIFSAKPRDGTDPAVPFGASFSDPRLVGCRAGRGTFPKTAPETSRDRI